MIKLYHEDCINKLPCLENQSVNFIFCDPPYPEAKREYGKLSTEEWFEIMQKVVMEAKRILKKDGSACFILQPNSKHIGELRLWLFEFIVWVGKQWNIVQDVWYHNPSTPPNRHCNRKYGLMRPSIKACVWAGPTNCYRNQDDVLLPLKVKAHKENDKLWHHPSGYTMRKARCLNTAIERGGSTPFNFLQFANVSCTKENAGRLGHGAGTPYKLTEWWIKYCTRQGDTVLDPFSGVGTTGVVCQSLGRDYIGIEKFKRYHDIASERLPA